MKLKCFKCDNTFSNLDVIIKHLKYVHFLKDNACALKCLVHKKVGVCEQTFKTFAALKKHVVSCAKTKVWINIYQQNGFFVIQYALFKISG